MMDDTCPLSKMTVKLVLLKSGEDIITDVEEMLVNEVVVGYFFDRPCVINIVNKETLKENKTIEMSFYPWIPLSKSSKVSVPSDWIVTMVDPIDKVKDKFLKDIKNISEVNVNE